MDHLLGKHDIPILSDDSINRFFDKVALTADDSKCWEWVGGKRRNGYGRFSITMSANKDISFIATRISYFLHYKIDPKGYLVCHNCDNPSCVNPNHLFLGSHKDNTNDMRKKGRMYSTKGEAHGQSKLTHSIVEEIKQAYYKGESQTSLAVKHNVYQSVISRIVNNKAWA